MKDTINKTSKMSFIHNGYMVKRTTKVQFGWVVDIIAAGKVVRVYECATLEEAKRCE